MAKYHIGEDVEVDINQLTHGPGSRGFVTDSYASPEWVPAVVEGVAEPSGEAVDPAFVRYTIRVLDPALIGDLDEESVRPRQH